MLQNICHLDSSLGAATLLFLPSRGCSRWVRGRTWRRQGCSEDVCTAGHGDRQTAGWRGSLLAHCRLAGCGGQGGGLRAEHVGGCLCTPAPARRRAGPAGWGKLGSSSSLAPDSAGWGQMGETRKGPGPQSKAWSRDRAGPPWGQCTSAQEAVSRGLSSTPRAPR